MLSKVLFFKDADYIRFDVATDKADTAAPQSLKTDFPTLPFDSINASILWHSGKAYFFKGDEYVRFDVATNTVDADYPQSIVSGWPTLPFDSIDACVMWDNGKAYFFKGDQYVRYDVASDATDEDYPQSIKSGWSTLPFSSIDACVKWGDGKVYFFKDNEYVRYDMANDEVDADYPQTTSDNWMGVSFDSIDSAILLPSTNPENLLIVNGKSNAAPYVDLTNWKKTGVKQYAGSGNFTTIKGIVLHETAGWTWSGTQPGTSVQLHIERDGKVFQHSDLFTKCSHAGHLNGTHIGIEHVHFPFDTTNKKTKFEDIDRQQIVWGAQNKWLIIPPYEQLKASVALLKILIAQLDITANWVQFIAGSNIQNAKKHVLNKGFTAAVDTKEGQYFLIGTNGTNCLTEFLNGSKQTYEGLVAHGVSHDVTSSSNHNDGAMFALYSWLVLAKNYAPLKALNTLQAILTDSNRIIQGTLRKATTPAFFVDVSDI
jgi:Hemopexin/N-acetylmuramoyl-L-alanine amidase